MKINGILLEFAHQETRDNKGQYSGDHVFKVRIRRESKKWIGEEITINLMIPEFKPRNMVKEMRRGIDQLIEIRKKALQNAEEMKANFKEEAAG